MRALRTSEIHNSGSLRLVAVESVQFWRKKSKTGCQLFGNIKPTAVIICSPDGVTALDMDAKPANLDQLKRDLPELDAVIAPFGNGSG